MGYGKITSKQREILEVIKAEILNKGYPPTVRDICEAVNLKSMAETVVKNGGNLPQTVEGLTSLPGVGRKTANVVLAVLWDIPALAVDTHVGRVANRLGISDSKDPLKIEQDVTSQFPPEKWNLFHRLFIWHGRKICAARKPLCSECPIAKECLYYHESVK